MSAPANQLFYGDCLTIMQDMKSSSVDLIYLDPPFNSNRAYNAIYKDETGRPLPDQIDAFCDLWTLNEEHERIIKHMPILLRDAGISDETVEFWRLWMNALRGTQPSMLAYLAYMVQRLVVMKRLLRPAGSIYLHCDSTASHYIKVMMDGIFGHDNFKNEIVWRRTGSHNSRRSYGAIHDTILFYTASDKYIFNAQKRPYSIKHVEERYTKDEEGRYKQVTGGNILTGPGESGGESGAVWKRFNPTAKDRHWAIPSYINDQLPEDYKTKGVLKRLNKLLDMELIEIKQDAAWPHPVRYLNDEDGLPYQDIWAYQPYTEGILHGTDEAIDEDVMWIGPTSTERMGYKTQKSLGLLKRIISVSTNPGDIVLDPFCGCATTLEAAHKLDRKWIGIDIAIHAVKRVAAIRLGERCHLKQGQDFEITGVPHTLEGAKDLWTRDKYHFQKWAVEEVDGFVTTKRTADGGIDGRLYFDMPGEKDLQSMVLEVKGGKNVTIADLRALHSVLEREEALMAGLIIMEPLGERKMNNFQKLAAEAGDLDVPGSARVYPRVQILSVPEILEGKRFHTPTPMGRAESAQKQIQI